MRLAIGLMSGTSVDAIDVALIASDGQARVKPLGFYARAWTDEERALIRAAMARALELPRPGPDPLIDRAADLVDARHIEAVRGFLARDAIDSSSVTAIGYHGQTLAHRPERGWTWQIGSGAALASALGIDVVDGFRSHDVAAGGQGAPLLPVYHRALCADVQGPVAVLNLGGVGNITVIAPDGTLTAFDTGPGNALIDDWVQAQTGARFDRDGALALSGTVDEARLAAMLALPWFAVPPPKSLDRADFSAQAVAGLSVADGAATLTAFTAASVARALKHIPAPPKSILVAGGGRRNPALMAAIAERTGAKVSPIEAIGADGDATEAEGFAYMALRSIDGLPISFPGTTDAPEPLTGGTLHRHR